MRQLGGSFGLAMVNTFLHIRNAEHRSDIVSHLTTDNAAAMDRLNRYTQFFMAKGASAAEAHRQALKALENVVAKQSSQLSFSDAYLIVGLVFLAALPMIVFASKQKQKKVQVILADH